MKQLSATNRMLPASDDVSATSWNESSISFSNILKWVHGLMKACVTSCSEKFPFSIVYAIKGDIVYIVAVAHGSREPEYWRPRVQDR